MVAPTASCPSPPTPTPTPCQSRFATRVSKFSLIPARTVTAASRTGVAISGPHLATTPSRLRTGTSRRPVGPTLWIRGARTRLVNLDTDHSGDLRSWSAEHDGYTSLDPPASHQRTVRLESAHRRIEITDEIRTAGAHPIRLAFHLGPTVPPQLDDHAVALRWDSGEPSRESATLQLPAGLHWTLVRASTHPILGWYSRGFGQKEPTTTVLGEGTCAGSQQIPDSPTVRALDMRR